MGRQRACQEGFFLLLAQLARPRLEAQKRIARRGSNGARGEESRGSRSRGIATQGKQAEWEFQAAVKSGRETK